MRTNTRGRSCNIRAWLLRLPLQGGAIVPISCVMASPGHLLARRPRKCRIVNERPCPQTPQ
ncbi:MAG: hypothetical protein OXU61_06965 [Gammaproteobacteria bacterium]|nr:hypothetical protein [Gammaproteobacteria bacterium]